MRIQPPMSIADGVTLTAAPGHNCGHLAVRVESGDEIAIYPGHLVLSLRQIDDPAADLGDSDLLVASATRSEILGELAERQG